MYSPVQRKAKQTIDWKLVICYLLLVIIGWVNVIAASHSTESINVFDFTARYGKQLVWILTSFVLAAIILFVLNPRLWEVISIPIYLFVVLLLVAVIFLGTEVKGSHSWFTLGPVRFQPAEISKIATSLVLAMVMGRPGFKLSDSKSFFLICFIIGLPMMVILAESETGSALVYLGFVFMLYREGLSGWLLVFVGISVLLFILTLTISSYVAVLTLAGIAALFYCLDSGKMKVFFLLCAPSICLLAFVPGFIQKLELQFSPFYIVSAISVILIPYLALRSFRKRERQGWIAIIVYLVGCLLVVSTDFIFNNVLQDHQRKRIEVLLGMKDDPTGIGYNVNQSMIAIGSGGLSGKGFLQGTQTAFGFVPEQSTDFIFCTVGEEWGFLGCCVVILLYFFLIYRIITDAEDSREGFTRIFGYCTASLIFMHLFINIGMTIGLMPVIGIPLPFLSYGGSSLWAFTILLFIFISLYRQEKKYY